VTAIFIQMGMAGGLIAFDLPDGTIERFGANLQESEARELTAVLSNRVS
jgi:hypothetical protein